MKLLISAIFTLFSYHFLFSQTERYHRIEVPFHPETIKEIHRLGIAIDYIQQEDFVWLEISESEINQLIASGLEYEVMIEDIDKFYRERNRDVDIESVMREQNRSGRYTIPTGFSLGSMGGFSTYNEILAHMDNLAQLYPGLISTREVIPGGVTVEGRPIYWQIISNNPATAQNKPRVLYTALTHGREPGSMQQMLYFMYYILENYGVTSEITELIDNTELYFIPCVNPDGYIYNQTTNPAGGGMWRKNRRPNGDGTIGVDNNRNFGYNWAYNDFGSSPIPSSATFRGNAPFSEVETQLVRNFCQQYNFSIALNYHTYGGLLLHPWGYVSYLLTPDHNLYQEYGAVLTRLNDYRYGVPGTLLYVVNGDACDWMYGEQTIKQASMAFTCEVGTNQDGFWPEIARIIPQCQENLYQNIMAGRLAGFYATFIDFTPINLSSQSGWLTYGVKRIGLADKPFSVEFEPLNDAFLQIQSTKNFYSSNLNTILNDSIQYILRPGLRTGDAIKFRVALTAEGFAHSDTITKIYGIGDTLLYDPCSSLVNWTASNKWNSTNLRSKSPLRSIGNAPGGVYPANENTNLKLKQPIDLTSTSCAWLTFYASWDLNGGKDWVKLMASADNGVTWTPLRGRFMDNDFILNEPETFVYRGQQDSWVKEWISLKNYCGGQLLLGFWFSSDASIGRAGFFFDDFSVLKLDKTLVNETFNIQQGWNAFSGNLVPNTDSFEELFATDSLLILENLSGFYQPGNPQSTLIQWDETTGYFFKSPADFTLEIEGSKHLTKILDLKSGWNLIPVLSDQPVPVNDLTTIPPDNIEIIRDAAGVSVFWPEQDISTLEFLLPKKSYLIKLKQPALLYFGNI